MNGLMKAIEGGAAGEDKKEISSSAGSGNSTNNINSSREETGSNSSNNGENNSDNSALISLGNTSFGFNFDSEEGNTSPNNSNSENGDGDNSSSDGDKKKEKGQKKGMKASQPASAASTSASAASGLGAKKNTGSQKPKAKAAPAVSSSSSGADVPSSSAASATEKSSTTSRQTRSKREASRSSSASSSSQKTAAEAAIANMQSIADAYTKESSSSPRKSKPSMKRKAQSPAAASRADSGGYNSDGESESGRGVKTTKQQRSGAGGSSQKKKPKLDDYKREERNAREKERSFRISKQITELRDLLATGGVIVPKGTKSSVLSEAATYIRMLQQHQYRSEIDRHQLIQQIQMIGGGALGQPAANAVRHVAAQNGIWSLGNFGGVPPKSAMMYYQPGAANTVPSETGELTSSDGSSQQDPTLMPNKIEPHEYRYVFNSCAVGMAIASMGGAFIDCNKLFCDLSEYTKQEVCSMTIFNLTARQDLQNAFDLISQMLSSPPDQSGEGQKDSCTLRGALKNRTDLGLSVSLIKGEDGVAKCFCVTLVNNPSSPFDASKPTPATIEFMNAQATAQQAKEQDDVNSTPAYTTG